MGASLTDPYSIWRLHPLSPASGFHACPACAGTMADHSDYCPLLNAAPRGDDDNALIAGRVWLQLAEGRRPLADAIEVATYLLARAAEQEPREDKVRETVDFYISDRLQMIRIAKLMAARGEAGALNPNPSPP